MKGSHLDGRNFLRTRLITENERAKCCDMYGRTSTVQRTHCTTGEPLRERQVVQSSPRCTHHEVQRLHDYPDPSQTSFAPRRQTNTYQRNIVLISGQV